MPHTGRSCCGTSRRKIKVRIPELRRTVQKRRRRLRSAIHFAHATFAEFRSDAVMCEVFPIIFSVLAPIEHSVQERREGNGVEQETLAVRGHVVFLPPGARCASNSGLGASGSKVGFDPIVAFTATTIIFPFAPRKNSSFPLQKSNCTPSLAKRAGMILSGDSQDGPKTCW